MIKYVLFMGWTVPLTSFISRLNSLFDFRRKFWRCFDFAESAHIHLYHDLRGRLRSVSRHSSHTAASPAHIPPRHPRPASVPGEAEPIDPGETDQCPRLGRCIRLLWWGRGDQKAAGAGRRRRRRGRPMERQRRCQTRERSFSTNDDRCCNKRSGNTGWKTAASSSVIPTMVTGLMVGHRHNVQEQGSKPIKQRDRSRSQTINILK